MCVCVYYKIISVCFRFDRVDFDSVDMNCINNPIENEDEDASYVMCNVNYILLSYSMFGQVKRRQTTTTITITCTHACYTRYEGCGNEHKQQQQKQYLRGEKQQIQYHYMTNCCLNGNRKTMPQIVHGMERFCGNGRHKASTKQCLLQCTTYGSVDGVWNSAYPYMRMHLM